jgi:hypothetical protein
MAKVTVKFEFDDNSEHDNVNNSLYNLAMLSNYRSALFEFCTFYQRFIKHREKEPTVDEMLDMIQKVLNEHNIDEDKL